MKVRTLLICMAMFCGYATATINPSAPIETKIFEPLLGSWSIKDSFLQSDGSWKDGPGADWNWRTILNGFAIQDDWIAPGLNSHADTRQYGTNIRIYNPKENRWEMSWMANTSLKVDNFVAKNIGNSVVMTGIFNGNASRISFYNMSDKSFDWKLEYQDDKDNTWTEVYRIKGTKKKSG